MKFDWKCFYGSIIFELTAEYKWSTKLKHIPALLNPHYSWRFFSIICVRWPKFSQITTHCMCVHNFTHFISFSFFFVRTKDGHIKFIYIFCYLYRAILLYVLSTVWSCVYSKIQYFDYINILLKLQSKKAILHWEKYSTKIKTSKWLKMNNGIKTNFCLVFLYWYCVYCSFDESNRSIKIDSSLSFILDLILLPITG